MKEIKRQGRPKRTDKDNTKASSVEKGTFPGERRKTYIVTNATADRIEAIAFWDRETIKETVHKAFIAFIEDWEKKNGTVKPLPK